jgi:hypothetical protein
MAVDDEYDAGDGLVVPSASVAATVAASDVDEPTGAANKVGDEDATTRRMSMSPSGVSASSSVSSIEDVFLSEVGMNNNNNGDESVTPGVELDPETKGVGVELSSALSDIKLAFVDARSTKPLVDKLNSMFLHVSNLIRVFVALSSLM